MPQCVEFKTPTFAGDPMDRQVLMASSTHITNCNGYVLLTPQEYSGLSSSIWVPLSIADGASIAMGIALLWAIAHVFRSLASSIRPSSNEEN